MKIAISQPTYLPWLGYFDLLDQVDQFVFLDSVQYEKRSWQQRNRIKTPAGLQWLTVPAISRGRTGQCIGDVEIEAGFWRDHIRSVEMNYRRSPFFDRYFGALSEVMQPAAETSNLATLTICLIDWLADMIGIRTPVLRSSTLLLQGKRTELLAGICESLSLMNIKTSSPNKEIGPLTYLSPLGSADYLVNDLPLMNGRGVHVEFQHYEHPEYRQLFPPFLPFASVLDLLFNEGENALGIIRSGRRPSFSPGEVAQRLATSANSIVAAKEGL